MDGQPTIKINKIGAISKITDIPFWGVIGKKGFERSR